MESKNPNLLLVIAVATAIVYFFAIDAYYEKNKDDPDPELFMPKLEKSVYESEPYPTTEET